MNGITNNFILQFEKKNKQEQNIIENEILNYLTKQKNKELFKEIHKFIINEINTVILNMEDYDTIETIIQKHGKDKIMQYLFSETNEFEFHFKAKQWRYSYEIEFEIKFTNFTYWYVDGGDIGDYGYNKSFDFTFDETLDTDMQNILKNLFYEDIVKENCFAWLNKYSNINF